ncbi:WG repeat-containing protein [Mangrovibacterium lignilyticum]|uniref:WG repeat-containing protein n=1 Tax=Mangrovibacterium lignilyticum TaxID=2668052 RepID=UPI0013D288AC|nr:WG repeat-containing protein [Mangrovibacterium lignilyticum]
MKSLVLLFFVALSVSCIRDHPKVIIQNESGTTFDSIKISSNGDPTIFYEVTPDKVVRGTICFNQAMKGDGCYQIQLFNRGIIVRSACFGYYTNGASLDDKFRITIPKNMLIAVGRTTLPHQTDTLFRINEGLYELGVPCGYANQDGDTIIPIGKYAYCLTDTIIDFGIVMHKGEKAIAIDRRENFLYEVYWFDNGPDRIINNRFRIIQQGKIGYANRKGEIVIKPQFQCATPFKQGAARVSYSCDPGEPDKDGHQKMTSNDWFRIDVDGNQLSNKP